MNDAMTAEFDTVAEWTADVAVDLGPDHYLAAACRGSGGPPALDWLLDHLDIGASDQLLDCGAGLGGPAAYAAQRRGARALLVEPEAGAGRGACRLHGLPVVRGDAAALPVATNRMDVAWSLGVLCTVPDQLAMLVELRRVSRTGARIGLLVYVARVSPLPSQPEGNSFPSIPRLLDLIAGAGLRVDAWTSLALLGAEPSGWHKRVRAVEDELERRHGAQAAWRAAQKQSIAIGDLIRAGDVDGLLISLRAG